MRVLIIGAGIVGYTLAEQLSAEGADVYVIEQDYDLIRRMNDNLDVFALHGSGTSQESLETIGIAEIDLMVAVTRRDEVNVMSCLMASQYGVGRTVARVKNPEFVSKNSIFNKANVGVDLFINSQSIVVEMIERLIEVPGSTDVAYLGDTGDIQIRGFELKHGNSLEGKSVRDVRQELAEDAFSFLAITRAGKTFVPDGSDILKTGDRILVLLAGMSLNMFLPMLSSRLAATSKVVLFGASQTALQLALRLEDRYEQVILLEPDFQVCENATKVLNKTLVINGSALDKGTLEEIAIETADVFVCLSEGDEDNFMAAMMAKQYGAKRTISLTEKPAYLEILGQTNIDIVINPRLITVGKILQFLRRGKVLSAAKLTEGEAEVLEYEVADDSAIVGKKIKTLRKKNLLPQGCRVAAIKEENFVNIPDGETVIKAGQSVVMFVLPEALEKVQNLFSSKKWSLL